MTKFVFNGKNFIKKNKRGTQRYTSEIILSLDQYIENEDVELLIPDINIQLPPLKNIKIVKYGGKFTVKGWQYIYYQYYILKNKAVGISLSADGAAMINPGIVAIHDMRFAKEQKETKNLCKFLKNKYNLFINYMIEKNAKYIITVSQFSKREIIDYYKHKRDNIIVIYNAWEHLKNINIDEKKLKNKYKSIINQEFYFFLGGMEKNKNLKWIYEIASKYKDRLFIMAGPPLSKLNLSDNTVNITNLSNLKHIGFITDEEMGFFMKHCKAFIFPSLYEGFGIPPLEALYFGAKVLCSNASCLPEIYHNSVSYFDPYDYNIDLDKLLLKPVDNPQSILRLYSWNKSSKILYSLIKNIDNR